MGDTLLVRADYILPVVGKPFRDGFVLSEDGKIIETGRWNDFSGSSSRADEFIDGKHCALLPGFLNSHTHLREVVQRGLGVDTELMDWLGKFIHPTSKILHENSKELESIVGRSPWDVAYELSMIESVHFGITTFRDHACNFAKYHVPESIAACRKAGIRGVFAVGSEDLQVEEDLIETREKVLDRLDALRKEYHDGNKILIEAGPHAAFSNSSELLLAQKEYCERHGLRMHAHCAESVRGTAKVRELSGKSPVKYFGDLDFLGGTLSLAHLVQVDDSDIKLLASSGTHAVHNPEANCFLASGIAPVTKMMNAGINVAVATDGPASNNDLDIIEAMRFCAMLQKAHLKNPKAMPVSTALETITVNAAKNMGLEGVVGRLEVGTCADLVLVDFSGPHTTPVIDPLANLVYSVKGTDVRTVIADGKILMKDWDLQLPGIDVEKTKAQAQVLAEELVRRLGR